MIKAVPATKVLRDVLPEIINAEVLEELHSDVTTATGNIMITVNTAATIQQENVEPVPASEAQAVEVILNATAGITNVVRLIPPIIVLVVSGSMTITNFAMLVATIRPEDAKTALAVTMMTAEAVPAAEVVQNVLTENINVPMAFHKNAAMENGWTRRIA